MDDLSASLSSSHIGQEALDVAALHVRPPSDLRRERLLRLH